MAFLSRKRAPDREPAADPDAPPKKKDEGIVRFLLTLAVLAWAIRSFFIATFYIPSGSMVPTLYIGDYLFVSKWPYGYSRYSFPLGIPSFEGRIFGDLPQRGDVVVFRHPVEDSDLIKRVIGLPGDTVAMQNGRLILNGRPVQVESLGLKEVRISPNSPCVLVPPATAFTRPMADGGTACLYPALRETLPGGPSYTILDQTETILDEFGPVTVPDGHLFVMGDNRDFSADSRVDPMARGVGFLPADRLIGKALFTVWSTDGSASYWKPWTWFTALRGSRIGNSYTGDAE